MLCNEAALWFKAASSAAAAVDEREEGLSTNNKGLKVDSATPCQVTPPLGTRARYLAARRNGLRTQEILAP
jgi:hypothetical protein